MLHILSLGLGVQSTTLAMMFENGDVVGDDGEPVKLDGAIFADTGAEPASVYQTLEWLRSKVSYPIHVVMHKNGIYEDLVEATNTQRFATPPFFAESKNGQGLLRRQCTMEYKIEPIVQQVRRLLGLKLRQRGPKTTAAIQYIGISLDEAIRAKPARHSYIEHRFPLIHMGLRRLDCLTYMESRGYPLPGRSACTFCPYRGDREWMEMKESDPVAFEQAVRVDEMIRGGLRGTSERLYVHRSMQPLSEIDFSLERDQIDMFNDECEGMCGV